MVWFKQNFFFQTEFRGATSSTVNFPQLGYDSTIYNAVAEIRSVQHKYKSGFFFHFGRIHFTSPYQCIKKRECRLPCLVFFIQQYAITEQRLTSTSMTVNFTKFCVNSCKNRKLFRKDESTKNLWINWRFVLGLDFCKYV